MNFRKSHLLHQPYIADRDIYLQLESIVVHSCTNTLRQGYLLREGKSWIKNASVLHTLWYEKGAMY